MCILSIQCVSLDSPSFIVCKEAHCTVHVPNRILLLQGYVLYVYYWTISLLFLVRLAAYIFTCLGERETSLCQNPKNAQNGQFYTVSEWKGIVALRGTTW